MKPVKIYRNSFLNIVVSCDKPEIIQLLDSLLDFSDDHLESDVVSVGFDFAYLNQKEVLFSHHEFNPKGIYQIYGGIEHSTASVDISKQQVKALIFNYDESLKEHILETIFMRPLRSILANNGFYYIHSGLLSKDQECVLIIGESGSGKSTISATGTKLGYKIACDDNLFLKLVDGNIVYYPLSTKIGANEYFLKRFPDLKTQTGFTYGDKARVSIKELPYNQIPSSYICKAIIFPTFKVGSQLEVKEISKQEVIKRISEQSLQRYPEGELKNKLTPGNFWIINKLARNFPAYSVTYGEENISDIFKIF